MKDATGEFNEDCIIGKGGFGVYKGYIDIPTTVVAIKRLNASSNQGFQEFQTEIRFLSKLRHVQLVSLVWYCDDEDGMILVYYYISNGTLRDHLYKTKNPHLTWKRRLEICIGSAKGLHYLHTGANLLCGRPVINRELPDEEVTLAEWGKLNYRKRTLNEIVDKKISGEISANCLIKFGEVAISCSREIGNKRPKMEEVVWELEFAMKLQETAEKIGVVMGEMTGGMMGNQEFLFPMNIDVSITEGSTGVTLRHDMSSTDNSRGGFESESFFTQTSDVSKGTSSEVHG
ncbi:hypothetical protein L2E82_19414 [Cichorium intybus]|uniref:Uncharacterized protein n=1 Tax=Cichorium intybus TaxID=13427 RepID=A0ACB9FCL1_CICIN|nr:hypothetical protein L2E82_19414 [Cichorium intybus]